MATSVTTIHRFGGFMDGNTAVGSVITDDNGNIYGMTSRGGYFDSGTIYSRSSTSDYTIIHSFGKGLVLDASGNSQTDGLTPDGSLVMVDGILYGTTPGGGRGSLGTLFSCNTDGSNYTILQNFGYGACALTTPSSPPVVDTLSGILYGVAPSDTTASPAGGIYVYHISTGAFGSMDFDRRFDIYEPHGSLCLHQGILYGTGSKGGAHGKGGLFSISMDNGSWSQNIEWSAPDSYTDPTFVGMAGGNVTVDTSNNLYFVTRGSAGVTINKYSAGNSITSLYTSSKINNNIYSTINGIICSSTTGCFIVDNAGTSTSITSMAALDIRVTDTMLYLTRATGLYSIDIATGGASPIHSFVNPDVDATTLFGTVATADGIYGITNTCIFSCGFNGVGYTKLVDLPATFIGGCICLTASGIAFGGGDVDLTNSGMWACDLNGDNMVQLAVFDKDRPVSIVSSPDGSTIYGITGAPTYSKFFYMPSTPTVASPIFQALSNSSQYAIIRYAAATESDSNEYVYMSVNSDKGGVLFRAIVNTEIITVTIFTNLYAFSGTITGLAVNGSNIYGCTNSGIIYGGSDPDSISTIYSVNGASFSSIQFNNAYLYATNKNPSTIFRVDIAGNNYRALYTGTAVSSNIILTDSSILLESPTTLSNLPITYVSPPPPPPAPGKPPAPKKLHAFGSDSTDGKKPISTVNVNGTIYGICAAGGAYDAGTIFSNKGVIFDGHVYDFPNNGHPVLTYGPRGTLVAVGDTIYGIGGDYAGNIGDGSGFIFNYNTTSSTYTLMLSATGSFGELKIENGYIYSVLNSGTSGGQFASSVNFRIPVSASGLTSVPVGYDFGTNSVITTTIKDGVIYGAWTPDGTSNTLFSIGVDGTNYQDGLTLADGDSKGSGVVSIGIEGNFIYGYTAKGGAHNQGTIFRCVLDMKSEYTVLHDFDLLTGYPTGKEGQMTIKDGVLYGSCANGGPGIGDGKGTNGGGVLYSCDLKGTYTVLNSFVIGLPDTLAKPGQATFDTDTKDITFVADIYTPAIDGLASRSPRLASRSAAPNAGGLGSATLPTIPMAMNFNIGISQRTVTLPIVLLGSESIIVDWGDASSNTYTMSQSVSHVYNIYGPLVVYVYGDFAYFTTFGSAPWAGVNMLTEVTDWGENTTLANLSYAFNNAIKLTSLPATLPHTVTNVSHMLEGATAFTQDISTWVVTAVANYAFFFTGNTGIKNGQAAVDCSTMNPHSPFTTPSNKNSNITLLSSASIVGTQGSSIFIYDTSSARYSVSINTYDGTGTAVTPLSTSNICAVGTVLVGGIANGLFTYTQGLPAITVIPYTSNPSQLVANGTNVYFANSNNVVCYNLTSSVFTATPASAPVGPLTYYDGSLYGLSNNDIIKYTPSGTDGVAGTVTTVRAVGATVPVASSLVIDAAGIIYAATTAGTILRCDTAGQNSFVINVSPSFVAPNNGQNILAANNGYLYGVSTNYIYQITKTGTQFLQRLSVSGIQSIILDASNNKIYHQDQGQPMGVVPFTEPTIPTPPPANSTFSSLATFPAGSNPGGFIDINGTLYGTSTSGLFKILLGTGTYTSLQSITGCTGQLYRIDKTVYGMAGQILFSYNTTTSSYSVAKTFVVVPNAGMAQDASGNLYMTDSTGGVWVAGARSGTVTSVTSSGPIFDPNGAISVDGGFLYGIKLDGSIWKMSLTTPYTATDTTYSGADPASILAFNGTVYGRFGSALMAQPATTLHTFGSLLAGQTPVGPTLIDRINQRLYGICQEGGGGVDALGTNAAGCLYSIDISNNAFTRIIDYVVGDAARGANPASVSITAETGVAYVVAGGGSGTPQPLLVFARVGSGLPVIGSGTLPGFAPQCFGDGTKILVGDDVWVPIESLRVGDIVTTYKHGPRPITHIGKGSMINNPEIWYTCMYVAQREGHDPLLVTGGHSFLVDYLTESQQRAQAGFWGSEEVVIDDKVLMVAPVSDEFKQITDRSVYTYYHFVVANDGDDNCRYGVWANGFLTETPSMNQFIQGHYSEI